jgi:hypothetical protein
LENHCPELKKRKEIDEATIDEDKEPSNKAKHEKTYFFFYSSETIPMKK